MSNRILRKVLAAVTACSMILTGCAGSSDSSSSKEQSVTQVETTTTESVQSLPETTKENITDSENSIPIEETFVSLGDQGLLDYMEDSIYADLEARFQSDDYVIENVYSKYISKEYIEELEYNSKKNDYFGFTLDELEQQFQGKPFIFTLGEDGKTKVEEFKEYESIWDKVIKDVMIGTGVILFCVTVSIVSAGAGAPVVSAIFAASAKTGTTMALSGGVYGVAFEGVLKAIETGDLEEALKGAALGGAKGFKLGAISGAVAGGASEAYKIFKSGKNVAEAVGEGTSIEIGTTSEKYAQEIYKGKEQMSYLGGAKVPQSTPGATRPDIVLQKANGAVEAVEVKNYDLVNHLSGLKSELKRQVGDRVTNLPAGSTQRIALVTKGRGYTKEFTNKVVEELQSSLFDVYGGKIPIDVI